MTSALITGSGGFIGFHTARRLLEQGYSVTGYDAMTPYYDVALKEARVERLNAFPGYRHIVGRLEDAAALMAAAEVAEPDVILHFAAQAGVRYSIEAPQTYIDSNLTGSWNVLEVARAIKPRHVMLASTSSVYGANERVPFAEDDRADEPLSLYAATKKGMEAMAHSYSHLFHIPVTAFRFFTVYGPWGRPDMALFKFVDAIRRDQPIDVYGHGEMARDFTYVDDLVEAVVRLLAFAPAESNRVVEPGVTDTLSRNAPFRVVNIAGGHPVALMSFIQTIEACLGRSARLNLLPMQPGDVPRTFADAGLLKAITGYQPSTPVDAGVRAFVDWHCAHYPQT